MRWSCRHPMAMEIFDVYKGMNAMFGVGAGRVILRSVAEMLALQSHKPPQSCHTRQGTNAFRNAQDLLRHYKLYHGGIKVRMEQTHPDLKICKHTGSQPLGALAQLGSRAINVDFVSFSLASSTSKCISRN